MRDCKKHRRCSPSCPPRRLDGTPIVSLGSLCLLCFNTGCQIPTGDKQPPIDKWIEMHPGTMAPPRLVEIVVPESSTARAKEGEQ
jgi:hypothetical protein